MNITVGAIPAGGRHLATAAGTVIAMVGVMHMLPTDQVDALKTSVDKITDGVTGLWTVLGPILMGVAAKYAVKSATPAAQAASLVQQVPETRIITTPAIAAAVPDAKVLSTDNVQVVSK